MNRRFSSEITRFTLYVIAFIIIVLFVIGFFYLFINILGLGAVWIITLYTGIVMAFVFVYVIKRITKNQIG